MARIELTLHEKYTEGASSTFGSIWALQWLGKERRRQSREGERQGPKEEVGRKDITGGDGRRKAEAMQCWQEV